MSAEFDDEFGVGEDLEALLNAPNPPKAPPKKGPRPKVTADPVTGDVEAVEVATDVVPTPEAEASTDLGLDDDLTEVPEEPVVGEPTRDPDIQVHNPTPDTTASDLRALLNELAALRSEVSALKVHRAPVEIPANAPPPHAPTHQVGQQPPTGLQVINQAATTTTTTFDANALLSAQQTSDEVPVEGTLVHFIEDGFTIDGRVFYRGQEYVAAKDAEWANLTGLDQIARYGRRFFRPGPWDGDGFDLEDPSLNDSDRKRLLAATRRQQELREQYA